MLPKRFRRRATTGTAVDVCDDSELLRLEPETLTLEQKVTRYFEQWHAPVHRYLVAAFGHPEEAEEITQEAFLKLYRTMRGGEQIGNARAWVFRAAHNLAIDRIRGQQFIELLDEESWEELQRSLKDAGPNPEQRLLLQEKFHRLRASIARLTPQERQCLHLRTKGLRYREIAEVLELGATTVAETLYRVIDKLTRQQNNG
jgi:RNA polymerase sigma-70 factor (ECF subfamily)